MIDVELNDLLIKSYRAGKEFGLIEGRKQGALETYKNVLDKANRTVWDNNDWQLHTRRKIKELEEGVEK